MATPLDTVGEILLPERKLWDGAYSVALANTTRGQRPSRPPIGHLGDVLAWSGHVGVTPRLEAIDNPAPPAIEE